MDEVNFNLPCVRIYSPAMPHLESLGLNNAAVSGRLYKQNELDRLFSGSIDSIANIAMLLTLPLTFEKVHAGKAGNFEIVLHVL